MAAEPPQKANSVLFFMRLHRSIGVTNLIVIIIRCNSKFFLYPERATLEKLKSRTRLRSRRLSTPGRDCRELLEINPQRQVSKTERFRSKNALDVLKHICVRVHFLP